MLQDDASFAGAAPADAAPADAAPAAGAAGAPAQPLVVAHVAQRSFSGCVRNGGVRGEGERGARTCAWRRPRAHPRVRARNQSPTHNVRERDRDVLPAARPCRLRARRACRRERGGDSSFSAESRGGRDDARHWQRGGAQLILRHRVASVARMARCVVRLHRFSQTVELEVLCQW